MDMHNDNEHEKHHLKSTVIFKMFKNSCHRYPISNIISLLIKEESVIQFIDLKSIM